MTLHMNSASMNLADQNQPTEMPVRFVTVLNSYRQCKFVLSESVLKFSFVTMGIKAVLHVQKIFSAFQRIGFTKEKATS